MTYIGFDFSCNKPACYIQKYNRMLFILWPLEMDEKSETKLSAVKVKVNNRTRFEPGTTSTEKFRWHIQQVDFLVNCIVQDLKILIDSDDVKIAFEGSSFGSKGDAALQLAGYRYLLVSKLADLYGLENIYTYAPPTIKSMAGCATKDKRGKNSMIEAFKNENVDHPFCQTLRDNPENLKKKTNYIEGVDDLVDAYWTLKTLIIKEKLS